MLAIYRAPNGRTYQYEKGTQPEGYKLVTQGKARTTANKARATATKAAPKRATTRKKASDDD